jgi:purine-binding chemotaxis protein CheW
VDWAEIRRRVEAAGRLLAGEVTSSPEHVRQVLDARARVLARPAAPPARDAIELVTFGLAREVYAVESRFVLAVAKLAELAPLPGAESPVFGLTAWRGGLLTVLDLRRVLGLSVTALNDLSRLIVLGRQRPAFGILADAVHGLVALAAADVRPPPEGVAARREYLRGVTAAAVLVLDAERLLRARE